MNQLFTVSTLPNPKSLLPQKRDQIHFRQVIRRNNPAKQSRNRINATFFRTERRTPGSLLGFSPFFSRNPTTYVKNIIGQSISREGITAKRPSVRLRPNLILIAGTRSDNCSAAALLQFPLYNLRRACAVLTYLPRFHINDLPSLYFYLISLTQSQGKKKAERKNLLPAQIPPAVSFHISGRSRRKFSVFRRTKDTAKVICLP